MPFINTRTTVALDNAKKETLTAELCRIAKECLGKGENWVMTGYEDNASLSFRGSTADIAYVEVKSYGSLNGSAAGKMTGQICDLLNRELSLPADRVYVSYYPTDHWGWGGNNF